MLPHFSIITPFKQPFNNYRLRRSVMDEDEKLKRMQDMTRILDMQEYLDDAGNINLDSTRDSRMATADEFKSIGQEPSKGTRMATEYDRALMRNELADKVRVEEEMQKAARDFKKSAPMSAAEEAMDAVGDTMISDDSGKMARALRRRALMQKIGKPIARGLGKVGQFAGAMAPALGLLGTEEANAGSDDISKVVPQDYNPSPQAQQQMFNEDAEREAKMDALRRLLQGR
jgi:hypothetical protein